MTYRRKLCNKYELTVSNIETLTGSSEIPGYCLKKENIILMNMY